MRIFPKNNWLGKTVWSPQAFYPNLPIFLKTQIVPWHFATLGLVMHHKRERLIGLWNTLPLHLMWQRDREIQLQQEQLKFVFDLINIVDGKIHTYDEHQNGNFGNFYVLVYIHICLLDSVKLTPNRSVSVYIVTLSSRPLAVDVVTQRNFHPNISGDHVNCCHLYSKAEDT